MSLLYAGTDAGLYVFTLETDVLSHVGTTLEDAAVQDVEPIPGNDGDASVACADPGWGVHRVENRGASAYDLGVNDRWGWGVTVGPHGTLFAGTEPPGVYRSTAGGESWTASPDVEDLAAVADWFFWSEPFEAGHVHGFDVHPDRPDRILCGVEIGAALRSDDGGTSWDRIEDLDGIDCHNLAVAPADPGRWYAASGDGLFRSTDGGARWEAVEPLQDDYVAKVAFDAAGRPCVTAALDSTADDGTFWRLTDEEWASLDTSPANSLSGMIATHPTDPDLLVHTSSTADECRLLVSRDGGTTWATEGPSLPRVRTLSIT